MENETFEQTEERYAQEMRKQERLQVSRKVAGELTDHLNVMSDGDRIKSFIEAMTYEHRTLQQSFTRLCFEWIKFAASDEFRFDGRNEQTHTSCKALVELTKNMEPYDVLSGLRCI